MIKNAIAAKSEKFGEFEVDPGTVFHLESPFPGLEDSHRYVLLNFQEFQPILWFQSLDQSDVALPILDPWSHFPDYQPTIEQESLNSLGVTEDDEIAIYCVVAPEEDGLTLNLAAPIVLYGARQRAAQVILDDEKYGLAVPLEMSC